MKLTTLYLFVLSLIMLTILPSCSDKEKTKSLTESGMKCGAGKCGASMLDGSAVLLKKKVNILDQLKKDDNRRDCVLKAKTTKALYACVRDAKTGRLKSKCSTANVSQKKEKVMKCESGKCGTGK